VRVGRPIKAFPQPLCDYCGAHAALVKYGDASYPYRDDHGAFWVCTAVQLGSASTRAVHGTCRWDVSPTERCATRRSACTTRSSHWFRARSGAITSIRSKPARKRSAGSHPNSASIRCQRPSTTCHSTSANRRSSMSKRSSHVAGPLRQKATFEQSPRVAPIPVQEIIKES
jgi:hypothetical protein